MTTDSLEPIRRVFRSAGLYAHAADDLLCQQLAAAAQRPLLESPLGDIKAALDAEPGKWMTLTANLRAVGGGYEVDEMTLRRVQGDEA